MPARSTFMILVGTGRSSDGEALIPDAIITLYDERGVLSFELLPYNHEGKRLCFRWDSDEENFFDNAFLMTTNYLLCNVLTDDKFKKDITDFSDACRKYFKVDPFKEDSFIDTTDSNCIAPRNLRSLYKKNKKIVRDSGVKFVAVLLASRSSYDDGIVKSQYDAEELIKDFHKKVKEYRLQNVEICTPTWARFFGYNDH